MTCNVNTLKIKFCATNYNGWPSLRFCIDNDVLEEYTFDSADAEIELSLDLIDGEHVLEIERYGKTDHNVHFVDGKILADQQVELVDLYADNIKLPNFFKFQGIFYFNDQAVPYGLVWGPNGKYVWKFQTPIINWLVDQKNQTQEIIKDCITPGHPETQKVYDKLNEFEQVLNKIKI